MIILFFFGSLSHSRRFSPIARGSKRLLQLFSNSGSRIIVDLLKKLLCILVLSTQYPVQLPGDRNSEARKKKERVDVRKKNQGLLLFDCVLTLAFCNSIRSSSIFAAVVDSLEFDIDHDVDRDRALASFERGYCMYVK